MQILVKNVRNLVKDKVNINQLDEKFTEKFDSIHIYEEDYESKLTNELIDKFDKELEALNKDKENGIEKLKKEWETENVNVN